MMYISGSMFLEIALNSRTKIINRPNARRRFSPDEMLICGVPSENGSAFGYFICQSFLDLAGVPERFVTWFVAKNFDGMGKIVVVGPPDAATYRLVNDIRPGLDLIRRVIVKLENERYCDSPSREITSPPKPAKNIGERDYWKLQQNRRPDPRCRVRGKRHRQY